jgi:hypothetical protein
MEGEIGLLQRDRIPVKLDKILLAQAMAVTVKAILTAIEAENDDYWVNVDLNVHVQGGRALQKLARVNVYGDLTKDLARDVQEGLGDGFLMEKYHLNPKQLESLLRTLLEADLITEMQLYERTSISDSQVTKAFIEAEKAVTELY